MITTKINTTGFILALFLVAASFYFQYVIGLAPCVLCIAQRILMMLLVVVFFWGLWIQSRILMKWQQGFALLLSLLGVIVSLRHLYVQYFPSYSCGPNLEHLWQQGSVFQMGAVLFKSHSDCTEMSWHWLGLSMPAWTLLFFTLFVVLTLIGLLRR